MIINPALGGNKQRIISTLGPRCTSYAWLKFLQGAAWRESLPNHSRVSLEGDQEKLLWGQLSQQSQLFWREDWQWGRSELEKSNRQWKRGNRPKVIPRRHRFKIGISQEVNFKTTAKKRDENKIGSITTKQHVTIQALRQEEIVTPGEISDNINLDLERGNSSNQGAKRENQIAHSRIVDKSTMLSGPQEGRSKQSTWWQPFPTICAKTYPGFGERWRGNWRWPRSTHEWDMLDHRAELGGQVLGQPTIRNEVRDGTKALPQGRYHSNSGRDPWLNWQQLYSQQWSELKAFQEYLTLECPQEPKWKWKGHGRQSRGQVRRDLRSFESLAGLRESQKWNKGVVQLVEKCVSLLHACEVTTYQSESTKEVKSRDILFRESGIEAGWKRSVTDGERRFKSSVVVLFE